MLDFNVLKKVALIVLAVMVLVNINPVFVVGPGEVGVTFNRLSGKTASYSQGMHFRIPGIHWVTKFDVKTQRIDIVAYSASKDLQKVEVEIVINTHLQYEKVNDLFIKVGKDYVVKVIQPAVNECVKAASAQFPVEDIIVKREVLKQQIEDTLRVKLMVYNIVVENVNLVNIKFDPEFEKVVEAKQIEEQKIKTAEYVKQQAEQNKLATIARAEGDAKAQQLLRESVNEKTIAYKWIDKWDGKLPETMLGSNSSILFTPKTTDKQ
ncbi:MAG: prohibitin family protein [Elusimicrobia bacterium]|nr:prohibitin family protein [Candidatus Liberimonas magnetica]